MKHKIYILPENQEFIDYVEDKIKRNIPNDKSGYLEGEKAVDERLLVLKTLDSNETGAYDPTKSQDGFIVTIDDGEIAFEKTTYFKMDERI